MKQRKKLYGCIVLLALLLLCVCGCDRKSGAESNSGEGTGNVHTIQADGETYYVLDREYAGDCSVQKVQFYEEPPDWVPEEYGLVLVENAEVIPEGFEQQTVMSAQQYAAYCETWGLQPAYTDPNKSYAVVAVGYARMDVVYVQLADVQTEGDTAIVYLRDRYDNPHAHSCGFVVTVPVDTSVKQLKLVSVYDAEEAENLQKYGKPYNPNATDAPEKPVIYLYPQTETDVRVRLDYDGTLTCTYPAYNGEWAVTAMPDGTLTDAEGKTYNYLYWEGLGHAYYDFSTGFCVRGTDTATFLEDALAQLGLTRREANEFIVYWLPRMEDNPYNLISFQTAAYTDSAVLHIEPEPDTLIRVFMAWKPLDQPVQCRKQTLTAPERTGFTVVEWGGAAID